MIGSSYEDKMRIYNNIQEFYDARSKLLHGRENKPFEAISETDKIVRAILMKVLKTTSNFDRKKPFENQYTNFLRKLDFGIENIKPVPD